MRSTKALRVYHRHMTCIYSMSMRSTKALRGCPLFRLKIAVFPWCIVHTLHHSFCSFLDKLKELCQIQTHKKKMKSLWFGDADATC